MPTKGAASTTNSVNVGGISSQLLGFAAGWKKAKKATHADLVGSAPSVDIAVLPWKHLLPHLDGCSVE